MEKYQRAYDAIQECYVRVCEEYGMKEERYHYTAAVQRLEGLMLLACADRDLSPEEFEIINDWKIRRLIDEEEQ